MLSYSWYENVGSLPGEFLRHALALDRSAFARDGHIVAIRISTEIGAGADRVELAEERIRTIYEMLGYK